MKTPSVLFIGATGLLARPVVRQMLKAGIRVKALVRRPQLAKIKLPAEVELVHGDIFNEESLKKAIQPGDIIYLNLSILPNESPKQMHTEKEGLETLLKVARENKAFRIAYLSSLVMNYQGTNGFNWWVFDIKHEAVKKIKNSGIPFTIFYPSAFMENFLGPQKRGKSIAIAGESKHPMWFIAGDDYGRQVVKSFELDATKNYEFPIQGLESFKGGEAARIFCKLYTKEELKVSAAPMGVLKFLSLFLPSMKYLSNILHALNEYPEKFESEETWKVLGKPTVTLKDFSLG